MANRRMVRQAHHPTMGWGEVCPSLSYKTIWPAGLWFMTGVCEFDMTPFTYKAVRQLITGNPYFGHLEAPDWLIAEIYAWMRPSGHWRRSPLIPPRYTGGALIIYDLIR